MRCAIEGCIKDARQRGWCPAHYEKWRLHGDPLAGRTWSKGVARPRTLMGRFWAKVRADHATDCWNWIGAHHRLGYGRMNIGGAYVAAHRFSYEQFVGPIPEGLTIDHLCRNPRCVNPEHLEAVTMEVNQRRMLDAVASRTHCKRGHEFAIYAEYRSPGNRRVCGECRRLLQRDAHARKKAA